MSKKALCSDLTQDIKDADVVMWIGAHPDDEIYVCGALFEASFLEGKQVYVVSLKQKFGEAHKKSVALLGLKDYISYPSGIIARLFGVQRIEEIMSEKIKELIIKKRPSLIITFEPTNGYRGHPEHMMASRITFKAIKKSGLKVNLYYVINRDEKLAEFLRGPMDPLPYTDVVSLDEFQGKIGKTLRDIKFELLEIYKDNVPEAKKLLENKEKQKEVLHMEFYRKVSLER